MRPIDADALRDKCLGWLHRDPQEANDQDNMAASMIMEIDEAPTIEPPVVHAYWKAPFAGKAVCSHCNEDQEIEMFIGNPTQKWCARCGAKMDADQPKEATT